MQDRNIRLSRTFEFMTEMRTRLRKSPPRRAPRRAHAEERAPRPTAREAEQHRARRDSGPADQAFYGCACGYAFEAVVSTSVACPHCGAGQAW